MRHRTMRRRICSTILASNILAGSTGCDLETDESIAAQGDEFRMLIVIADPPAGTGSHSKRTPTA